MCTVTYLPKGPNQYIFTTNRDEAPSRSAVGIVREMRFGKELLFPRDPLANGTWIATSDSNQMVCILNGAFEKHKHRPPYRLSRGIMALDFFSYDNATNFFANFEFEGIEPFTMIIFDDGYLYELRWDEQLAWTSKLDENQPHLWSSCTLYNKDWQRKRRLWFYDWQDHNKEFTQEGILHFHHNAGEGNPEFDVIMNRQNIVRTTSITSINKLEEKATIRFEDLINVTIRKSSLEMRKKNSLKE